MTRKDPWNSRRSDRPDISQSLEAGLQRGFAGAAWLLVVVVLFNVCGLIGAVASLLDRMIQGEDYVPYIGAWTAAVLFVVAGFGSTSLLNPKDRSGGIFAMSVFTLVILAALIDILHGSMSG
ncbi:hypothetical protein LF1_09070 [Rubripirellula obstinata]|uniref:Uncharacterized protein n=1 Tax=Rubripirellula obstinata TaxID=406547 RepID=A0A5B1CB54_9BACT|nr:hypothetical protein [Rubripirellula obstinata]KAA1258388.1 hypothetical protein LF1_09070 [Rubripirellula obstinata]